MTGFEKGQNVPKNLNMINKVCASHHITDSPGLLFFFFFFILSTLLLVPVKSKVTDGAEIVWLQKILLKLQ